jgi:hypothetical protein
VGFGSSQTSNSPTTPPNQPMFTKNRDIRIIVFFSCSFIGLFSKIHMILIVYIISVPLPISGGSHFRSYGLLSLWIQLHPTCDRHYCTYDVWNTLCIHLCGIPIDGGLSEFVYQNG